MEARNQPYETFRVYEIVSGRQIRDSETSYAIVYVTNFATKIEAEQWIKARGEREKDYTILHVFRT